MNDGDIAYIEFDPKHFKTLLSATCDGETATGSVEAVWMEDRLYPRMFEIIASDHPWIRTGDKVYIVAGSDRPQG